MSQSLPPPLPPEYTQQAGQVAKDEYTPKLNHGKKAATAQPNNVGPARSTFGTLFSLLLALALLYPMFQLRIPAELVSQRAQIAINRAFFQLDNEEGALLYQAMELNRGHNIYKPLTSYPYVVGTYPPLYMFVTSLTLENEAPNFSQGRFLSWICAMGIAVVIALLIGIRTKHVTAGALSAMLFLSTWEVYQWIAYYRVDFPAIYLSMIGLAFVVLAPRYAPARVMAIFCFTLGLYTKQTVIAAPLACIIALTARDWRVGLKFAVMLALAVAIPFAVLTAATRGQYAIHTVLYNMNTFHSRELRHWYRHVWFMHHWLLVAACIGAVCAALVAALRRTMTRGDVSAEQSAGSGFWRDFAADPIYLYALFSMLSFLAIAKAGTAENYLLEPLIGLVLTVGYSLGGLGEAVSYRGRGFAVSFIGASATAAALFVHTAIVVNPNSMAIRFNEQKNPSGLDMAASGKVMQAVREEVKPTFTELAVFNLRANRNPVLQPFILSELSRQKRWDQKPFLDDIRAQKFGLIVTQYDVETAEPTDIYTPEMVKAIRDYYEEESMVRGVVWPKYHLLRPRKEPREASFDKYLTMAE